MLRQVHASLRSRLRQVLQKQESHDVTAATLAESPVSASVSHVGDAGPRTQLPVPNSRHDQTVSIVAPSGEVLATDKQLHLYTPNGLLSHPLVSPVLSYLGGLPPLLFIAGDGEVLRDEIIYV